MISIITGTRATLRPRNPRVRRAVVAIFSRLFITKHDDHDVRSSRSVTPSHDKTSASLDQQQLVAVPVDDACHRVGNSRALGAKIAKKPAKNTSLADKTRAVLSARCS